MSSPAVSSPRVQRPTLDMDGRTTAAAALTATNSLGGSKGGGMDMDMGMDIPGGIGSSSSASSSGGVGGSSTSSGGGGGGGGAAGAGTTSGPRRCAQCQRRTPCHHHPPTPGTSSSGSQKEKKGRPRRITKLKHRASTSSKHDNQAMEPPVLSFYGTEPVPLPSRFAQVKRNLVAGHEAKIEASWVRLLDALRAEIDNIHNLGPNLTPSIAFSDVDDPARAATFARDLKRYGVGVVRGVMPKADADTCINETVKYLETKQDFKAPPAQDPTCFDFFWTPAQVRTRAHPNVLYAQKFAMSLWDNQADDRLSTRFPIAYADRLRVHGATLGATSEQAVAAAAAAAAKSNANNGDANPAAAAANGHATSGTSAARAATAAAKATAIELLGDFTSSTVIAQVDNGSLERWESDGYGRGGTYDAVFKGEWESYDPWDPTGRISCTSDLYNGYGACSIFRMYQGVLALNTIEPGMIRLMPSPKLATAYFLLRPFFSPKVKAPESQRDGPEWEAYLDASNWALDREQSTIIHGAVPGHAQRLTELWHPHLHIRRSLMTIPTLQAGDYILWHPDLAYHITSNGSIAASRAPTPPPMDDPAAAAQLQQQPPANNVSILVYVPAAPLTQTNALYLARQRKTFQRGHPGPDFDATGSGLGSEASHAGRPGEAEIAEIGGPAGLQAMGLAPFDVAPTPPSAASTEEEDEGQQRQSQGQQQQEKKPEAGGDGGAAMDVDSGDAKAADGAPAEIGGVGQGEAEVARLANIILFPDRYDFYMSKRTAPKAPRVKIEKE